MNAVMLRSIALEGEGMVLVAAGSKVKVGQSVSSNSHLGGSGSSK